MIKQDTLVLQSVWSKLFIHFTLSYPHSRSSSSHSSLVNSLSLLPFLSTSFVTPFPCKKHVMPLFWWTVGDSTHVNYFPLHNTNKQSHHLLVNCPSLPTLVHIFTVTLFMWNSSPFCPHSPHTALSHQRILFITEAQCWSPGTNPNTSLRLKR